MRWGVFTYIAHLNVITIKHHGDFLGFCFRMKNLNLKNKKCAYVHSNTQRPDTKCGLWAMLLSRQSLSNCIRETYYMPHPKKALIVNQAVCLFDLYMPVSCAYLLIACTWDYLSQAWCGVQLGVGECPLGSVAFTGKHPMMAEDLSLPLFF